MAAVLAGGPGAVLSHRSAAALWEIRSDAGANVDVTVARSHRRRPGIAWHETVIRADEVGLVRRIPVTSVSRTLLDLATVLSPRQMERAINEAEVRRLGDALSLADLLARYSRRRGTATIRKILGGTTIGEELTRSELEERFLTFIEKAGLPRPEVNASIFVRDQFVEVDFLWRSQRLIVEVDGYRTHGTTLAFERDRDRDRALQAEGWRVVRVTWRQLHDDPAGIATDLRRLLAS